MRKTIFETPDIPSPKRQAELQAEHSPCAIEGCAEQGLYPAPKSRQNLREHIWLCLEHVRDYNKEWNYFEGYSSDAMEEAIRKATTWERPSQAFSASTNGHHHSEFSDPFNIFTANTNGTHHKKERKTQNPRLSKDEKKAWAIFGLSPCTDGSIVKKRYKHLAKANHPDANGGSKDAEDDLKTINWAYAILKQSLAI